MTVLVGKVQAIAVWGPARIAVVGMTSFQAMLLVAALCPVHRRWAVLSGGDRLVVPIVSVHSSQAAVSGPVCVLRAPGLRCKVRLFRWTNLYANSTIKSVLVRVSEPWRFSRRWNPWFGPLWRNVCAPSIQKAFGCLT